MIHIPPRLLWLGNAGDGRDPAKVLDAGIRAVIQLAMEEPPVQLPRDLIAIRIPLCDGSGNSSGVLRLAITTLEQLLILNIPTLLCCSAGMSRTPAVAACALARLENRSPIACLEQIGKHLGTDVSPQLWHELLGCFAE